MNRTRHNTLAPMVVVLIALSGCASYRVSSNVEVDKAPASAPAATQPILIAEDSLPGRQYTGLGPVEVSVKKLTVFHQNPTKEQANEALIERARKLGADAVVNVKYDFGIGWTTWGYMDAKGMAVKFVP